MSSYLNTIQLSSTYNLFQQKESELKKLIGNLQIEEVKEEDDYKDTRQSIKNAILLTQVTFEEPKIGSHSQNEKNMPPSFEYPIPHKKLIYEITVEYTFQGSRELFRYRPDGLALAISNIYQPEYSNIIKVDIEATELNKEKSLQKAKELMSTTFELISQMNPHIEQWSKAKEIEIEEMLKTKRDELISFYS